MSRLGLIVIIIILVPTFCGCEKAGNKTSSDMKKEIITLKLSHIVSPEHPWQKALEHFAQNVNEKTGGRVVIEIYPNASLSHNNERTMVEQCQVGTLDMALFPASQGDNRFAAFSFPFQFASREAVNRMLKSDVAVEMLGFYEEKGIKGLAYWENGFRQLTNNKHPILTPEDMEGLKIRVPQAPQTVANIKAMGANPVSVSLGELYIALQQGVVDGQENVLSIIYNERLYEVQKYCTVCNYSYSPQILGIHTETYNRLPDDIKKVLLDEAREGMKNSKIFDEQDLAWIEGLREKGMEVHISTKDEILKFKNITNTEALKNEFRRIVGTDLMNRFMEDLKEISNE